MLYKSLQRIQLCYKLCRHSTFYAAEFIHATGLLQGDKLQIKSPSNVISSCRNFTYITIVYLSTVQICNKSQQRVQLRYKSNSNVFRRVQQHSKFSSGEPTSTTLKVQLAQEVRPWPTLQFWPLKQFNQQSESYCCTCTIHFYLQYSSF